MLDHKPMNRLLIIFILLLLSCAAYSQAKQKSADELKKEMAEIRRNTDWGNEAEANKSQAKIEELSKQLMMIRKVEQQQQAGATVDSAKLQEDVDYKMKLWSQMMKIADQGEGSEWDLAKPLREEIVEAYLEDQSPKKINPEVLNSVTFLRIDMSMPTVQRTIDVMQNFKAIKTLIITGGANGAPVNLETILSKAADYPLKSLYIINFRQFVSSIPWQINNFSQLETVALFNNNLDQLPDVSGFASSLDSLFVDINPLSTLFPQVSSLVNLKKLGVAKTSLSEAEINQIQLLLPECKIVMQ
jgi:hypothetical protein